MNSPNSSPEGSLKCEKNIDDKIFDRYDLQNHPTQNLTQY